MLLLLECSRLFAFIAVFFHNKRGLFYIFLHFNTKIPLFSFLCHHIQFS
nr:MAG TPA: hypothetical protein [Bacteriophage sp.]